MRNSELTVPQSDRQERVGACRHPLPHGHHAIQSRADALVVDIIPLRYWSLRQSSLHLDHAQHNGDMEVLEWLLGSAHGFDRVQASGSPCGSKRRRTWPASDWCRSTTSRTPNSNLPLPWRERVRVLLCNTRARCACVRNSKSEARSSKQILSSKE